MSKKIVALVVFGLLVGSLAAPVAAQAQFVGAINCTANLPEFPSNGNTTSCDGTTTGVQIGGATCVPSCSVSISANYQEPCLVPVGFPLIGTANGTISVNGSAVGDYSWTRVGFAAVIAPPGDTAGVGVLVPRADQGPVGSCGNSLPTQVTIVGLGAIL